MNSKVRGPILWLVVFVGGAVFQLWRGAPIDTLVYSLVALLVILAFQKRFGTPEFKPVRFTTTVMILLASTLVFIFSPIHSWLVSAFYLLLVPLVVKVAWQKNSPQEELSTPALKRASRIWFTIGSLTCICELGNYFASAYTNNDKAFPTITVLVDPIVAHDLGRVVFVIFWSMAGVGLLRISTKR